MEIIVRDEIMLRSGHFIDNRQHGFLPSKSCNTRLVDFCDSLALSLYKNIRSDVQEIETHYVSYYGWGLTPISKFKVNCLAYIIAGIQ